MVFYCRTTTIRPMKSYTHCVQPAMSMVNIPPKKNGDDLGMVDDIGFTTLYHMNSTNFYQFLPKMAPEPEHFLPKSAPERKEVDPCFDISPKSPEIESALLHAIFILHTAPDRGAIVAVCVGLNLSLEKLGRERSKLWQPGNPVELIWANYNNLVGGFNPSEKY